MESATDKEYYENPSLWGESQFITLKNVIDNMLLLNEDDGYLNNTKRHRLEIWGKIGLKKINLDIRPQNKAISFELGAHKTFPFPRYMKNWMRVSVLNKCGKLHELNINNRPEIQEYFTDEEGTLLFDPCDGSVLTGEKYNAEKGICCYEFECKKEGENCGCQEEYFENSWVKPVKKGNYFSFSEDLVGRTLVLEFICTGLDGIQECDVKVHQDLELTIMNFIMFNILKGKSKVPSNKWREFYQSYIIEKNRSEDLLSQKITLNQIIESVSLRYNS